MKQASTRSAKTHVEAQRQGKTLTQPTVQGSAPPKRDTRPLTQERFLARMNVDTETGCWLWTGRLSSHGYGECRIKRNGKPIRFAHRVAYYLFVGPIPEGLQLDHLCRVRHCVNPEHLEPVTSRENILRSPFTVASRWAQRTHCNYGHEFTPENTGMRKGNRFCRTCKRTRKGVA